MENENFVEFENIQKSYDGESLVVKNLNLSVKRGEFLTLLGPSGSGKTTCLLMLAGFEAPTAGNIKLEGKILDSIPPHQRDIGLVFQNYALFPHMTVAENLAFPLKVRGMAKEDIDKKIDQTLDMVRLTKLRNRKPAQLSGGQQQRVAVARALIFDPKLVLMDEPLSALDKNLRDQMQLEIREIHEQVGITVVYVTHDQAEAMTMSSRIVVFDDGIVQQVDPPIEIYEKPQSAFVAQFVGENNCLDGVVSQTNGKSCLVELTSGDKIQTKNSDNSQKGNQVLVSLRPERVKIAKSEKELDGCDNLVRGKLKEKIFLGDKMRARFSACKKENFVVNVTNKEGGGKAIDTASGQEMWLGWSVDDCCALRKGKS